MISTLKRTLTDIMEDELYSSSNFNDQINQQQQSLHNESSQQQQNDFFQYLSLPNTSQDSLQKLIDSESQNHDDHNNDNNNNNNSSFNNLDGIYNSYGNPNSYSNPQLLDYLYSNDNNNNLNSPNLMTDSNDYNYDYLDNNNINTAVTTPNDTTIGNEIYNNNNNYNNNDDNNNNKLETPDNTQDDILMIPQDNYFNYDYQDNQFLPEMLQFEMSNKNFPQSNELNLFKPNDVLYEFSDDEDEDEDIDLQNKLDNDMEMKFDDDDDDEEEEDDDNEDINNNNNSKENNFANNYLSTNDNSIYSLTIPNQFNLSSPSNNLYISEDEEDEDEHHNNCFADEDEDDYDENNTNNDLYSSAFKQRKESVISDSKPLIKKERSLSNRHTKPKRLRRSSNHLSQVNNLTNSPSLRKPKATTSKENLDDNNNNNNNNNNLDNKNNNLDSNNSTNNFDNRKNITTNETIKIKSLNSNINTSNSITTQHNDEKNEEHICTIPNPKTGKPCLKKFSRPYDLVRHQNTIHASKRSFFRCMFCEDDLRRKHNLDSINKIVVSCKYRNSQFSKDNSTSHITSSHNVKKIKSGNLDNSGYLSNKTFSRCDALTRHLRFRHGLNNNQVLEAMDFAKKNVEYYDN